VRDADLAGQLKAMPDEQLRDTRRDLQAGLGLMRRESPMYAPASAYLAAINAELARRAGQQA
jgi:predicted component of type VI protein secretion system